MQNILISGVNSTKSPQEIYQESMKIGNYFSEDRFYTEVNSLIDNGLRKYSLLMYLVTIFLFRSQNYKHTTNVLRGKPKWVILIDVFCWFCLFAFIVCLLTGIAQPLIVGIEGVVKGNFDNFLDAFGKALGDPTTITLFIFSVITFIIAMTYLYILKKVVAVNKKLPLKEFVVQKISFINRFENLIKVSDDIKKANKKLKKINKRLKNKPSIIKNDEFYLIDNLEVLGQTEFWLLLQISNILYNLFPNSGLIFKLTNIENDYVEKIKTICLSDFKHIKITNVEN